MVTYDFGPSGFLNLSGADIVVYETQWGSEESSSANILVSLDGISYTDISTSRSTSIPSIAGATGHSLTFARSYDLSAFGDLARYLRISGNVTGAPGQSNSGGTGFDLDAVAVATAIPEPSTYAALLGAATLGLALWRRRR